MTNISSEASVDQRVKFSCDTVRFHLEHRGKGKIPQRKKVIEMINVENQTHTVRFIKSDSVGLPELLYYLPGHIWTPSFAHRNTILLLSK